MKSITDIINEGNKNITAGRTKIRVADLVAAHDTIHIEDYKATITKDGESTMICIIREEPTKYFFAPNSLRSAIDRVESYMEQHVPAEVFPPIHLEYVDIGEGRKYIRTVAM